MVNSRDIKDLNPVLQRGAKEFLSRCKAEGLEVLITQTLRDIEYQNYLYAQGRTSGGSIVTNARGGQSYHNFGLAFDICKNIKGQEYSDLNFFKRCGEIWTEMGGMWGGNFESFVDNPHFEFINGLSTSELNSGKLLDENVKMKWEDSVVTKGRFLVDGVETEFNVIVYENKNYVELRELTKLGFEIGYDSVRKMPIVDSK